MYWNQHNGKENFVSFMQITVYEFFKKKQFLFHLKTLCQSQKIREHVPQLRWRLRSWSPYPEPNLQTRKCQWTATTYVLVHILGLTVGIVRFAIEAEARFLENHILNPFLVKKTIERKGTEYWVFLSLFLGPLETCFKRFANFFFQR